LREGSASKSRLLGHFDEAFFAIQPRSPRVSVLLKAYAHVHPDSEQNSSPRPVVVRRIFC
jgi:hypothetical protein